MRIYLSGGLDSNWQDEVIPLLDAHEVFDPRPLLDTPDFALRELEEVIDSDCVIGYFEKNNPSGQGLCAEMAVARFHPAKPRLLILCAEKDCFVKTLAHHFFDDFREMKKYLKHHFNLKDVSPNVIGHGNR